EITNYLASGDGPFAEDFGPDAWGGYDGPRAMSVSVSVQPEPVVPDGPLLDRVLHDVFVTAMEGGIGYWSSCSSYRWSVDDSGVDDLTGFRAVIFDDANDPSPGSPEMTIDRDVILRGYLRALDLDLRWNCEPLPHPHQLTEDGWECDAEDADVIVQLGLFNEVRYG
ncbi:MAG: phage MyraDee, partial [Actinomycetota bacterium]